MDKKQARFLLIVAAVIIDLNILGYVMVEVFDSKWGAILQAMRYFTLLKWIAWIVIASYIGVVLQSKNIIKFIALLASVLSPMLLVFVFVNELLTQNLKRNKLYLLLILTMVLSYLLYKQTNPEMWILLIGFSLLLAFYFLNKQVGYFFMFVFAVFIGVNAFSTFSVHLSGTNNNWFSENYKPQFKFNQASDIYDVCTYLEEQTPFDAIIIAPPNMPEVRVIGKRASVSCFKTLPFKLQEMMDWKSRLDYCFGTTNQQSFAAEADLAKSYMQISDERLFQIKEKYKASIAVLNYTTTTAFEVLYSNESYKVVKIN